MASDEMNACIQEVNHGRLALLVFGALVVCGLLALRMDGPGGSETLEYPNRPIQVVVPYAAGGGSDTFARIIQKSVSDQELLSQPLVILNQPGGGGTIGSRYVKNARPSGYRILCHHEAIITSQLSGTVAFGPEDFTAIAQTGNIALLVIVRADSPHQDLASLVAEAAERPNSVLFGADVGSLAHFIAMELEGTRPGAAFNYVTSGGGQKRFTLLLGGHLDAAIFSLSEYLAFRSGGDAPSHQDIRAIAVMQPKRDNAIPEIPTAMEQGFPISSGNAFYWWAPKGTPSDVVDRLGEVLNTAMQDPFVAEELDKLSIRPEFRRGEELDRYLEKRTQTLGKLAVTFPSELPNFPVWIFAIAIALSLVVLLGAWRGRGRETAAPSPPVDVGNRRRALVVLVVVALYVASLQFGLTYVVATALAIFVMGIVIERFERRRLIPMVQLALIVALGSELVFTRLFAVPLP